jgi:hypothetical protein
MAFPVTEETIRAELNKSSGDIAINNKRISLLADPIAGTDAVNKNYVDTSTSGSVAIITAHTGDFNNPHAVTPLQVGEYAWTWANAAARNAQTGLTALHVGLKGYQTDMQLPYRLVTHSPVRWARCNRPGYRTLGSVLTTALGGSTQTAMNTQSGQIGSYGARTLANTNEATALMRASCLTAASTAGSTFYGRSSGGQQVIGGSQGWCYRIICGPGVVAPDLLWYYGLANNLANGAAVTAMSAVRNGVLIGADGGQLGILSANGSASTFTPLGASFPGVTADEMYDTEFFSPDGTDLRYQVTRLSNGTEVSGILAAANMPTWSNYFSHVLYSTNNTTAVQTSVDLSAIYIQAKSR